MLKKILLPLIIAVALSAIVCAQGNVIYLLKVDEIINPASAGYIVKGIDKAEQEGASCLVIQMDTPGGLMECLRLGQPHDARITSCLVLTDPKPPG